MKLAVDMEAVEELVLSDKFTDFLVSNTVNFGDAAFILQTLTDKINEIKEENDI